MIYAFFDDVIQPKFPSTNCKTRDRLRSRVYCCSRSLDVFDVYIERNPAKVWLVDFNPFTPTTDGLLFDWSELAECKSKYKRGLKHSR